ncbi:MAG: cysteine desulfurase family protein, partial [Limisphaerales bacterium]
MQQLMRYFDHNATTGLDPQVLEAMLPFLQTHWANPSSAYQFARPVKRALAEARAQVAGLLQAQPEEILFTGCGTESINTALNLAAQLGPDRRHLVLSEVEHDANRRYAQYLERQGWEVTWLGVDAQGLLRAEQVREVLRPDTAMVSIMWANNETGVLFPMQAIAEVCQQQGVLLHTDAVQAAGKVEIDLRLVPADLLSLSAHKMHAPKGVGALFVRQGTPFDSYLLGGGQEGGRRAGTQNIP